MDNDSLKEIYFPFETVRAEQDKLLLLIDKVIEAKKNLLVHAPTGLGKTVGALGPALKHVIGKEKKCILFLTSRHTQHKIAIETLLLIKSKYNLDVDAVSIIGKMWMCAQPGVQGLYSSEFADYCKKVREHKKCEFYLNTRKSGKLTDNAKNIISVLRKTGPYPADKIIEVAKDNNLCPYELSIGLATVAKVIITDYYYLFNSRIGEGFLKKIEKNLDDIIVIVDEAHNLPDRLKDLASEYLSTTTLRRAIAESKKYGYNETVDLLNKIMDTVISMSNSLKLAEEKIALKDEFFMPIDTAYDFKQVTDDLEFIADNIRERQKQSYVGSVARFLSAWIGADEGFARIISNKQSARESYFQLSYRCLDPSIVAAPVVNSAHSSILMSGTLVPIDMYKELLGVENTEAVVFNDPYPKDNRLNLVIPKTTTKFSMRNDKQFEEIAKICSEIIDAVPGNSAIFFPSYSLRDKVNRNIECKKPVFLEESEMGRLERAEFLERFKSYSKTGAVLLAVSQGSFGEGIDLPGDLLKAVVVVGLPLRQPDLESKSLIDYYDKKFKKGWDYGYIMPAMTKCIQNAGRCIRSETDRGVIIFLDERFAWKNYLRLFPQDWEMKISTEYSGLIKDFFNVK
ncbi:MAG: ATP-dependent DNA helicase [archaeon]